MPALRLTPNRRAASYQTDILLGTKTGWFLIEHGQMIPHRYSEHLVELCKAYDITPEQGTFLIDDEVFFMKSRRPTPGESDKTPVSIRSFDVLSKGRIQTVEFDRRYRLYLAGMAVSNGHAYYWNGGSIFQFLKGGGSLKLCEIRDPVSELAVVQHDEEGFSFYHNDLMRNVAFNRSERIGKRLGSSIRCRLVCSLIGSYGDNVFGWVRETKQLVVIENGKISRKREWFSQPSGLVSAGNTVYLMFDGRVEIVDMDSLAVRTIWNTPKGVLAISKSRLIY